MKKKLFATVLACTLCVTTLLAGCGSQETPSSAENTQSAAGDSQAAETTPADNTSTEAASGEKKYEGVELTYWSMWNSAEPQGQALMAAAEAFEAETGAVVNFEWRGREIKNILASSLEAQEKIDLFEDDYSRITSNYVDYVADLTQMAEAAGYADLSYQIFRDRTTEWAGFLACVAEQPSVGGVFYNQDLFDQAGITTTPATWEEFLTVCQTLVDNGIQPVALDSTYAPFFFGYHLARNIGQDAVKELAVNGGWSNNAGAVQAAQQMIDFVNAGYLAEGAPDEYPNSQNKMGISRDVAMVVCANYVTPEVNTVTNGNPVNWGMFAYPAVEGGADPDATFVGFNSIAIPKYSENQQAAFDFALYVTTGAQGQNFADLADQIPADPNNTVPVSQTGTIEVLQGVTSPLDWNMGLNENGDLQTVIHETVVRLYEGEFATGEDFTAALDALY